MQTDPTHDQSFPASKPDHRPGTDCSDCGFPVSDLASAATFGAAVSRALQSLKGLDRDSLSELGQTIATVLRDGFMAGDPRSFDTIMRPADGSGGWQTIKGWRLDPDQVAFTVCGDDVIIGLRHRYQTRLCAVDLDNHGDGAPIWTRDSPELLALVRTAEAAGCAVTVAPSPRGLHLWLSLPEAVPIVRAHWCLRALLQRAGITGKVELFPSLPSGTPERDAKARPRSHGIRLPGQAGTVVAGDPWTAPLLIWGALAADLRVAAVADDAPAWSGLQAEAAAMERRHKRGQRNLITRRVQPCRRRAPAVLIARRLAAIQWTGPGQSNDNLGALANVGWRAGHRAPEALADFIETAALAAPGFAAYASFDTRRRLSRWSAQWASCCIARPPAHVAAGRPRSADPGRNARLRREAFCALVAACDRAAREVGEAALSWSARKVAEWSGIARTTLQRLRFNWKVRLTACLFRPRSAHPEALAATPTSKGGYRGSCITSAHGLFPIESTDLPLDPARSARPLDRKPWPPPPAEGVPPAATIMPTRSPRSSSHPWEAGRRERERAELAAWLGIAAA